MNRPTRTLRFAMGFACACGLAACSQPPAPDAPPPAASVTAPAEHPNEHAAPRVVTRGPPLVETKSASYHGILPCADCGGIDTHLILQRDKLDRNSYVLRQTYEGRSTQPITSAGTWHLSVGTASDPQLALIHLDSGPPAGRTTWRIDADRGLTLTDPRGKAAASGLNYSIKRSGGELNLHALYEQAR